MEPVGKVVMRYPGSVLQESWDAEVPLRGDLNDLAALVGAGGVCVLSGAGMSTDSGIPDYRGPSSAARRHTPMTYEAFVHDPAARHRYWARSHVGWARMARATPNDGHRALATIERTGVLRGLITRTSTGCTGRRAAGR